MPDDKRRETSPFSFPESTILACGRDRELWLCPTPEVHDSRTSRQIWQNWLVENTKRLLCTYSESWVRPELSIPATGQKDCGLWGRECKCHHQSILVLWKCTTSFTASCLIQDERHDTPCNALAHLIIGLQPLDGPRAIVRVDPAPGFASMSNNDSLILSM